MKGSWFVSVSTIEKCEKTTISENIAEKGNIVYLASQFSKILLM